MNHLQRTEGNRKELAMNLFKRWEEKYLEKSFGEKSYKLDALWILMGMVFFLSGILNMFMSDIHRGVYWGFFMIFGVLIIMRNNSRIENRRIYKTLEQLLKQHEVGN